MKSIILVLALIALCQNDESSLSCSNDYGIKKQLCESIKFDDENYCFYKPYSCIERYTECEKYHPSNFDEDECTSINLADDKYHCVVKIDENDSQKKTCIKELKKCKEFPQDITNCVNLDADEGYRCVLYNKKCTQFKETCFGLSEEQCANNIPKDNKTICIWSKEENEDDYSCKSDNRECSDYKNFKDKYGESSCLQLTPKDQTKTCYLNKEKCKEYYKDCSVGTVENCNEIKPLNDEKNGFKLLYTCKYSTSCKEEIKMCDDSKEGEFYSDESCSSLPTTDPNLKVCKYITNGYCKERYIACETINQKDEETIKNECSLVVPGDPITKEVDYHSRCYFNSTIKKCVKLKLEFCYSIKGQKQCDEHVLENKPLKNCIFRDFSCNEQYKTCDSYNQDKNSKSDYECKNIVIKDDPNSECFIDENNNNKCTKRKKPCKSIYNQETCINHEPDEYKRCIYKYSCKEMYKTCENFNLDEKNTQKLKEDCENIEPIYDDQFISKCVYNSEEKTCSRKKIICGTDYSGIDKDYCESLNINLEDEDKDKFICRLNKGNRCSKMYKSCDKYVGTEVDECNSIELENEKNICDFDENGKCIERPFACSDLKYSWQCYRKKLDDNKFCVYRNAKCEEMTILNHECSEYKGNDIDQCELISPSDKKMKCKFTKENGCEEKLKECKDATSQANCLSIIPSDPNQQCVYDYPDCNSVYKTCDLYQQNSDIIEKSSCERIIINDPNKTYSPSTHKCVYQPATTEGEKATCVTKKLSCSDFSRYQTSTNCER